MADRYPYTPGAQGLTGETLRASKDAAKAMQPSSGRLHRIALSTLGYLIEAAPFEVVRESGVKPCALQPRVTELIKAGFAEPTGARRINPETGKGAAVLRLTEKGRAML